MEISICYFSTIFSNGYKSKQLNLLINKFEKNQIKYTSYSIEYKPLSFLRKEGNNYKSIIPLIPLWIYGKLPIKPYASYFNYLIGEYLYYIVFRRKIIKDKSTVVLVRNRPSRLLKYIKKNTQKRIILEVDQQHPLFTKNVVLKQQQKYKITKKSIYLNRYAINDYIKSFKYADSIVVYTEDQKNILNKYGIINNIIINELGIEDTKEKINSKFVNYNNDIEFVCFANHSLLKGTHRLIEIWNKYNIKKNLFIVGRQEDDFKQFLKNQKFISKYIEFIEIFTKADLENLNINKNLVGILLSYSEGYPRVVSEYFENKIPVIVSEIINRDVEKLNFGKVVNNEIDSDIIESINLLSEMKYYISCKENLYNYNFKTIDDFTNNYIKIIQESEQRQ